MRNPVLRKQTQSIGNDDGFAKAVEIVVTPGIFAALGWLLDKSFGSGPWLAFSLGLVAFLTKITAEWCRYSGRMANIEADMKSERASAKIDLTPPEEIYDALPTGVTLNTETREDEDESGGEARW
ncbi:MAG: F0F1-type ATP synthase assembly protein I [Candidatus Poriferisodalaceae bacterium]|jgi:F0F1-type ATP synthase assembly protein I|tara:strand:+ start:10574 stop:10948 length:375 start_codon:yes stop_codon:yes gene_type:complete